jgi:hypothetical protein
MAHKQDADSPFTGFGIGAFSESYVEGSVFVLAIYRDGNLTAAVHATERGAMEAAVDYLESERDEDEEGGALEDLFLRAQRVISDEGGIIEIIASPVHGG